MCVARADGRSLATAYVLVKIALPGRIALSLVVVPWFARRAVEPVGRVLGRVWRGVARWKR